MVQAILGRNRFLDSRSTAGSIKYRLIECVPLDHFSTGLANRFHEFRLGLGLSLAAPRHAENMFFDDRPVDVIRAIAQRHLRQSQSQPHSIRGDVREIIQINATYRDGS